jgi:NAD(P)-dependent dehydrogenase (short-subunit alcohol dehydrogenase family)
LINCAGITLPNDLSIGAWEKTLAVNLTAPFIWMTRAAEYFELEKISGSIVSITSLSAELAFPGNPAYSASKGGLRQLTKSFAHRLGRLGICCNNVAPGYIETNFNSKSIHDEKRYTTRAQHSLLQRWGKPREIADMVRFLCSENSRFISGQDLFVDGGWSSQGLIEYE